MLTSSSVLSSFIQVDPSAAVFSCLVTISASNCPFFPKSNYFISPKMLHLHFQWGGLNAAFSFQCRNLRLFLHRPEDGSMLWAEGSRNKKGIKKKHITYQEDKWLPGPESWRQGGKLLEGERRRWRRRKVEGQEKKLNNLLLSSSLIVLHSLIGYARCIAPLACVRRIKKQQKATRNQ